MRRLYLVRHGNTFEAGEPPRRIGARSDLPLTRAGERQAEALGRRLSGVRFARAWCSPLQRTRETAALILAAQSQPPSLETVAALTEIDHGPDEGQSEDAVLARIGAAALAAWDGALVPPPGWDVGLDWRMRAWAGLAAELLADPDAGAVLAVTSGGAARLALSCLGLPVPSTRLRTGSYGVVGLAAGEAIVLEWDRRPDDGAGND